ncbi:hypothetical protein [Dyella japonica]|uniref:OmpA family protein n=1 Tax=Dyella japonica TaxID=231455 RepID=A0ABV2JYM6_9GAMM
MPSFKANRLAMMLCMVVTATGCDRGGESGNHGVTGHRAKVPTASSANQGPVKLLSESGQTVYCFQFPKSTYVSIPQHPTYLVVDFNDIRDITEDGDDHRSAAIGVGNYRITLGAYDNETRRDEALNRVSSYFSTRDIGNYLVALGWESRPSSTVSSIAISKTSLLNLQFYILSRAHRDATQRRDDAAVILKFIDNALTTCQGNGS